MNLLTRIISWENSFFLGLIGLLLIPSASYAGLDIPNPSREYELSIVKGSESPILGQSIKGYSVMAIDNGELLPIPFQFDDKNIKGLTFVPGAIVPVDGLVEIFEAQDELVFMYRDMGTKLNPEQQKPAQGNIISEFEITEDGISRYAYLVKGNPQRSDKVYAHYDFETGLIETETYTIQFDPNNITVWSNWNVKGFTGTKSAPNVLDTMKARFVLRLGFLKAALHNKIIPANTIAVKNGAVRAIVEADISIGALGINVLSGGVSVTLTPQSIRYPIFAYFPKAANALSEFYMDVTIDHVDFEGTRYRSSLGPTEPMIAGQKETILSRERYISDREHPWVSISSGHNWDMFFIARFNDGFEPKLSALFWDDAAGDKPNKPENFKGSSAEMGIRLTEIPVGTDALLEYSLYFGTDLWQGNNPERAAFDIFNPAQVTVNHI